MALFSAVSLASQGAYENMIVSMNPPSAAALSCSAMEPSWVVKPTNRTLPVFLIASISSFISRLLTHSIWPLPRLW